jgi:hypothetical protein
MKSNILTKVNKVNIQFKDRIYLKAVPTDSDLIEFVKFCHPKQDLTITDNQVNVFNNNSHYIYINLGTHYQRLNTDTQAKVYYKKS